jgi:SH3-like domain-containing protein
MTLISMKSAVLAFIIAIPLLTTTAFAQSAGAQQSVEPALGPVTNLPLPRYVSMKASKANVRRGPSLTHRIDWVFLRRNMPMRITAEHGHWRRVEDRDGMGGWMHYSMISGNRTVLVEKDMLQLMVRPDAAAPVSAELQLGVVAELGDCSTEWCELRTGGFRGWAPKARVWGVANNEIRD